MLYVCVETRDGKRLSITQIAKEINAPEAFTAKILQTLARHEKISSIKGPGGGFYISADAPPVKVMEIVDIMDGKAAFERCGLGLKKCGDKRPCPIHKEFRSYSSRLKNLLETKTIEEMSRDIRLGKSFLMN